jgi:hypothetical protein
VLFDSVLEAIPNCRGWEQYWKPGFADKPSGTITASVPFGISYGEQISIQITENPPGTSWLAILSTSNFGLYDFGKNGRNINKLIAAVQNVLAGKGVNVTASLQQAVPAAGAVSPQPPQPPFPSFCTNCGGSLTAGASFCKKCGSPV